MSIILKKRKLFLYKKAMINCNGQYLFKKKFKALFDIKLFYYLF
jgi:hypothetical protein